MNRDVTGRHPQEWVKVNAQVDKEVVPLIEALSLFPRLQTLESCQGHGEYAWVSFTYGDDDRAWRDAAEFVLGFLAPRLSERAGDAARFALRPHASGGVLVDLTIRPEGLGLVQNTIRQLAGEFTPGHSSACSDGSADIAP